jgi:hypothetical protein
VWTVDDLRRAIDGDLMSICVGLVGLDSQDRFRVSNGLDVAPDCVLIDMDNGFHGVKPS